ncbi:hypothetical protein [Streptomyces sp. CBMA152]|uniref:hypothetical protein n=1 Tax=Streptomyces sp. CBMA152 TaxID=1896312 RepID=UPI0016608D45|nr:hypothetical protein [Streptomyces sp. CBMA152]MBD0740730.1 hypothetical protein [Streptomyces sp. CBMA152]
MLAETVCSAASAAGLGIAAVTAYRKRFLSATRIAAYSLVPVALVMTGIVGWVSGIVFKPTVWAGFGLLGIAWGLFSITRFVERRRVGGDGKEREVTGARGTDAIAPAASAPSLGAGRRAAAQPQPKAKGKSGEDFSDIEAILKKHGI